MGIFPSLRPRSASHSPSLTQINSKKLTANPVAGVGGSNKNGVGHVSYVNDAMQPSDQPPDAKAPPSTNKPGEQHRDYVNQPMFHHHHHHHAHQSGNSSGGGGGGGAGLQAQRQRRTQKRVTHNEKRYHSGQYPKAACVLSHGENSAPNASLFCRVFDFFLLFFACFASPKRSHFECTSCFVA